MVPVSVVIISNKLDKTLFKVIDSFHNDVNEICIGFNQIDFASIQKVIENKYDRCKCYELEWKGYGPTKNELNKLAKNDWILTIDSDEVADVTLIQGLKKFDYNNQASVGSLKSLNYFMDKAIRYGSWSFNKSEFVGLFHKNFIQWSDENVHEKLLIPHYIKVESLNGFVHHYTSENRDKLFAKSIHYGKLGAINKVRLGKKYKWCKAPMSASFLWVKEYLFQLGFLDGVAGLQIANANAIYTYYKYAWMKNVENEE